jgi:hypothetical protein
MLEIALKEFEGIPIIEVNEACADEVGGLLFGRRGLRVFENVGFRLSAPGRRSQRSAMSHPGCCDREPVVVRGIFKTLPEFQRACIRSSIG